MSWHYSKYESVQERKYMFKGFLSMLVIVMMIAAVIALFVFFAAVYRTHPEYFEPAEVLLDTLKNSTPSDFA